MKNFNKLKIWQQGFQIAINTYKLTKDFPSDETLILKGIKFRGTKTKGHGYKHIEDAWDEGSPNTLKK